MSANELRIDQLFDISLSIGVGETLTGTAERALSAYIETLDFSGGAIFELQQKADGYSLVPVAKQIEEETEAYHEARDHLPEKLENRDAFTEDLPIASEVSNNGYAVLNLPTFGVLVCITTDGKPDPQVLADLEPLNEKLASACRAVRNEKQLSESNLGPALDRPDTAPRSSISGDAVLTQLYRESEQILQADGRGAICEQAMDSIEEIISPALACIHLYDHGAEALVPVSWRSTFLPPDVCLPEYTERSSRFWDVYLEDESQHLEGEAAGQLDVEGLESALLLPLGDHGMMLVAYQDRAIDRWTEEISRILSSVLEIALDRAERKAHLAGVQDITRSILIAETQQMVAEQTVANVSEVLGMPLSAFWEHDEGEGALRPIAASEAAKESFEELPTLRPDESLAWDVFQSGETRLVNDLNSDAKAYNPDSVIASEVIVPVGEFGILIVGSTHEGSFSETDAQLLDALGANLATALRLVSKREELQLQDEVLARILRHNIRNDLTAVRGFASGIARTTDGKPARLAERILARCHELERTSKHAREIQDIIRRSDDRATVSLGDVVRYATSTVANNYPAASIDVTLEANPAVSAHPELTTAVRHLIENGIEHHPEFDGDADVSPRVGATVFDGESAAGIRIEDEAGGIPSNEIEVLDRLGESSLDHASGAGLWIIDRVVEYSDAELCFEQTDNGSIVTVRFEQ